jgi:tRNA(fMet)-specific endonuclease VapC
LTSTAFVTEHIRVAKLIQDFISVPFSDKEAWVYGEIREDLHRRGTPFGQLDMMIAAVAKANAWILVTHNQKEFKRVRGLHLEDWQ